MLGLRASSDSSGRENKRERELNERILILTKALGEAEGNNNSNNNKNELNERIRNSERAAREQRGDVERLMLENERLKQQQQQQQLQQ